MSLQDEIAGVILRGGSSPLGLAGRILALPEMKEMMEKAEKHDHICELLNEAVKAHADIEADLDLIMANLEVREECQICAGAGERVVTDEDDKYVQALSHHGTRECEDCHGTGSIVRDATPDEVREALDGLLRNDIVYEILSFGNDGRWQFKLSNGRILRLRSKKG